MANHPSALKRARQNERKRLRNASRKTRVKNVVKTIRTAIESRNLEQAEKALKAAVPFIQKAGGKGVIHKRKASRQVSRLMKSVHVLRSAS